MKNVKTYIVVGGIALAGLSFGGGYFTGKNTSKNVIPGNFQQFGGEHAGGQGQGMGQGARTGQAMRSGGFRPVVGEVISSDDKSVTVKLTDGSSRIVLLNDTTSINKATAASKTDLKVGEKISAFGKENTDGSVSAQSIELNPVMRGQEIKN